MFAIPFAINLGSVAMISRWRGISGCNQRAHGSPMFAIPTADVCRSLQVLWVPDDLGTLPCSRGGVPPVTARLAAPVAGGVPAQGGRGRMRWRSRPPVGFGASAASAVLITPGLTRYLAITLPACFFDPQAVRRRWCGHRDCRVEKLRGGRSGPGLIPNTPSIEKKALLIRISA
jgi:hypothetical protein